MMRTTENIINSCRICYSVNQEGDYEYLFDSIYETNKFTVKLTENGQLYEEFMGLMLTADTYNIYPQYLCSGCVLQLKLFKKLKLKACQTLDKLLQYASEKDHTAITYRDMSTESDKHSIKSDIDQMDDIVEKFTTQSNNKFSILTPNNSEAETEVSKQCDDESILEEYIEVLDYPNFVLENNNNVSEDLILENNNTNVAEDDHSLDFDESYIHIDDKNLKIFETINKSDQTTSDSEDTEAEYDYVNNTDDFSTTDDNTLIDGEEFGKIYNSQSTNFSTNKKIRRKKRIYDDNKIDLKCLACNLAFNNSAEIEEHRKINHNGKYPCSKCSKLLTSPKSLKVHMNLHTDTLPYRCDICSHTFNQKVHWQTHMNRHNNIRNYQCQKCCKFFFTKADLKIHGRSHTGHRPYRCAVCGQFFFMYEHLKMHSYKHTQEKVKCSLCHQTFSSPSTLRQHNRTIHSEPRFKCEMCTKTFRRKHHLMNHLNTIHKKFQKQTDSALEVIDEMDLEHDSVFDCNNELNSDPNSQDVLQSDDIFDLNSLIIFHNYPAENSLLESNTTIMETKTGVLDQNENNVQLNNLHFNTLKMTNKN